MTPQSKNKTHMYHIIYPLFYALSLLPMRLLYMLSDCGYALLYHIIRYRRRIVRKNLAAAFPEKSEKERGEIESKFYRWFCDYFLETVKLLSISEGELRKRLEVRGTDEVARCYAEGQDCAGILGHHCNWEWLSCTGIALPEGSKIGLIYKPLRSKLFDRLFRRMRSSQPSGIVVAKNDILREMLALKRQGVRHIFGYIADQGPRWTNIHLWLRFLNQDTPVFTGAERIMRKMNNAVFFLEMTRPERGRYRVTFHLMTRDPASMPEHEVTRRFFASLEESIRRQPECYLWSHNRWKRTREEFDRRFVYEHGKVMPRKKD